MLFLIGVGECTNRQVGERVAFKDRPRWTGRGEPHKRRGFFHLLRAGKLDALLDEIDGPAGDGREIELACFVKRKPMNVIQFAAGLATWAGSL